MCCSEEAEAVEEEEAEEEEAVALTEMLQVDVGVAQVCVAWPPLPAKVTAATGPT